MTTKRLKDLNWVVGALILLIAISVILGYLTKDSSGTDPSGQTTSVGAEGIVGIQPANITSDAVATAQTSEPFAYSLAQMVNENRLGINFTWTLVAGFLVMLMQLGFALVETGFCRRKNALHVMAMNFSVYFVGMIGYFLIGFGIMFGGIGLVGVPNLGGVASLDKVISIGNWDIMGGKGFGLWGQYDVAVAVLFLFQMVFMDTTATIPTGAMAERWKWSAFMIYGLFVSAFIYPVYGMWAWGGGWLADLGVNHGLGAGYADFAGSGVVHAIGGWTALAGAIVLGARIGKFNKDGTSNILPGHNVIMALTGVLILGFGWFGFNPGSTLGAAGNGNLRIGLVAVATMLASASGALVAMLFTWWTNGKPDAAMTANGFLGGLVAITAPAGFVSPSNAIIIGALAGIVIPLAAGFVEHTLKVDDPVGAIAVHGFGGFLGQICVGLFADGTMNYNGWVVKGLFYGDVGQFFAQLIGAVTALVWGFGTAFIFFKVLDRLMGLRVSAEDEIGGLDPAEMGAPAYWDVDEPLTGAWPVPVGAAAGGD